MINFKILNLTLYVNNIIKRRICIASSRLCEYLNYNNSVISINNQKNGVMAYQNNLLKLRQILIGNYLLSRNISLSIINYAKSKAKEKKKSKPSNLDFRELNELYDIDKLKSEYDKSVENMKQEYIKNFTLRSIAGSVELLKITMEEKQYELQELAQVIRNPKLIVVNVNFPTAIPSIIQAIQESGLNINPQQDGTTIYLPIPVVTKEYREKLIKGSKVVYIKYRDEIKNKRSNAIKKIKNSSAVQDVIYRSISVVEKFTEQYLDEIESLLKTKQNELSGNSN